MRPLYRFCIDRPRTVIALGLLLCAAISPGVLRLRLRTDGNALIPPDAPEVAIDHEIRERFHLQDPFVVVVWSKGPEGIYNAHSTALIAKLTDVFQHTEGIDPEQVFSLATEFGDRVFPGTLNFRRLLEPLPTTPEDFAQLRADLQLYRLYTGMLVSNDGTSAALLVGARPGVDRIAMLAQLKRVIAEHATPEDEVSVIGAPVAEALLGTHILQDLGVPDSLLGLPREAGAYQDGAWTLHRVRTWIANHIGLVPIALLVMAAVFYWYFGSLAAVVLPLTEVGACLVVVFAIMGWLGVPIYLTIAVMPIILTAAGITDEIHVFARYRDRLRDNPGSDHREILLMTLEEIGKPVIMAGITTGIGFLAFALSPIAPVQAFGIFTAMGLAFCMVWSLTVIPASLSLLHPRHIHADRPASAVRETAFQRLFVTIASMAVRHRFAVIILASALALATPWGIRRVIVQDSWIDGFAAESEFRVETNRFNEQYHGGHLLLLRVDTGAARIVGEVNASEMDGLWITLPDSIAVDPQSLVGWRLRLHRPDVPIPDDPDQRSRHAAIHAWTTWLTETGVDNGRIRVKGIPSHGIGKFALRLTDADRARFELTPSRLMKPDVMQTVAALESFVETHRQQAVGGVVGTADYVETIHYLRRGRNDGHRTIPATVEEVDWLWREYSRMRGAARIRQLIDDDFSQSVITVFLRDANFVDTARLMDDIRDYEAQHLAPKDISLSFAGDVAVSQSLIAAIVGTQVISVGAALAGDFLVTVFLGRSVIFGLLCVVPSLLAVLLNFAWMGWVGMPLGVATSMFSSMTLGMGVDYAIHFLQNYREHLSRARADSGNSGFVDRTSCVIAAARTTGPAILGNTLAVTIGFGVLLLSQVPANARLGGLLVLSLFNCFAATMIVLPAVLGGRGKRRTTQDAKRPPQA